MKTQSPKKLYIRKIANGTKISVGEYINVKWNNVIDPFYTQDRPVGQPSYVYGRETLKHLIASFQSKNAGRPIVAVLGTRDNDTIKLCEELNIVESY